MAVRLVYEDMLLDENVGPHIAWGMGYTTAMDGIHADGSSIAVTRGNQFVLGD